MYIYIYIVGGQITPLTILTSAYFLILLKLVYTPDTSRSCRIKYTLYKRNYKICYFLHTHTHTHTLYTVIF